MNDYQFQARSTAVYPKKYARTYPALGLVGEVGEFCNKYKKVLRDKKPFTKDDACSELGDILWYLSILADDMGITLEEVAQMNLDKLYSRQQRGTLQGSGDNR